MRKTAYLPLQRPIEALRQGITCQDIGESGMSHMRVITDCSHQRAEGISIGIEHTSTIDTQSRDLQSTAALADGDD